MDALNVKFGIHAVTHTDKEHNVCTNTMQDMYKRSNFGPKPPLKQRKHLAVLELVSMNYWYAIILTNIKLLVTDIVVATK